MPEHGEFLRTDLGPEAQLLLCCTRTQMDAGSAERLIALLQEKVDWNCLLQLAFRHNLVPLLYRSLEAVCPAAVPETARAELKEQVRADAQRNLFLTKELLHLLALFDRHGIAVVPYKGPVLAASIYGDLVLRPFHDLDILVREQDLLPAMDLLAAGGYQIVRPPDGTQVAKSLQSHWAYQLVLVHADRQVLVELHWRLMPQYFFRINPEQLWEKLIPIAFAQSTVLSLASENLLWFLCVHGAKHHWRQLSRVCDVAELLREYPNLNWEQIGAQAKKLGVERRLYLGLLLANGLLKAPLPKAIKTKVYANPAVKALAQQVVGTIFDDPGQPPGPLSIGRIAFDLRTMERVGDRGRYLRHFVIRPIRRAKTYALGPFRRLLR